MVLPLFPNPTSAVVHLPEATEEMAHIHLMDLLGAVVLSTDYVSPLDLSPLAQGTYLIVVSDRYGRPMARARVVKL
jgi:hypothetical protein